MPGQVQSNSAVAAGDGIDDLFDYDVNVDDVFKSFEERADAQAKAGQPSNGQSSKSRSSKLSGGDLGIDEEIKVAKKRQPVAKLDEERLLSQKGIPKLRRIARERLKFKGKGHEFKDIQRMLNLYQLWLDDLYPRAKFMDGLAMIEKLGHSKRMQVMRKEWVTESKNRKFRDHDSEPNNQLHKDMVSRSKDNSDASRSNTILRVTSPPAAPVEITSHSHSNDSEKGIARDTLFLTDDEEEPTSVPPPEDDLDALLAEDEHSDKSRSKDTKLPNERVTSTPSKFLKVSAGDDFADEMEAMADMDELW